MFESLLFPFERVYRARLQSAVCRMFLAGIIVEVYLYLQSVFFRHEDYQAILKCNQKSFRAS